MYGILKHFRPEFLAIELKKIISPDCRSLLDVGCGNNSIVRLFADKFEKTVGIDIWKDSIEESRRKKIHSEYIQGDVRTINKLFSRKSFDCVLSLDVIEHLDFKESVLLIKKMETIAKRLVILQTTNGFLKQEAVGGNIHQTHKSGFTKIDLVRMGYKVYGMDGPKFLRTVGTRNKYIPKIIISLAVNLLDPFFRYIPDKCFNLLAFKYIS